MHLWRVSGSSSLPRFGRCSSTQTPARPSRDGQAAVKGDAPSRAAGNLFPPAAELPLHRETNSFPAALLHMRFGPEGGVKGRPP